MAFRPTHPLRHALSFSVSLMALATVLHLALPAPALATEPAAFAAAFKQLEKGSAGDKAAIEAGAAQWRALSAAEPTDPVLRAYAGAMTSMLANTTLLPWKKLSHAEEGLALLDKALAQLTPAHDAPAHQGTPASLETRFVAANTFLALPAMFNRGERGAQLLDQVLNHPRFDASPAPFKASVWMRAAQQAKADKREADARRWLQKAASSNAPQAALAQAQLKAM